MANRKSKNSKEVMPGFERVGIIDKYEAGTNVWKVIEHQFIQGLVDTDGSIYYPNINELAKIHNLTYPVIKRRVVSGEWLQKREQWQRQVNKWVHYANTDDYIQAAAKFDATCITMAQKALDTILTHLIPEDEDKPIGQLELDRLGRAAVNWQRVGRLALGLSTENNSLRKQEVTEEKNRDVNITLLNEAELSILDSFITKVNDDDKISEHKKEE